MQRNRLIFLAIVAIGVFVLLVGYRDITASHEARVAQTARTMARSGWPWNAKPVEVPATRLQDDDGVIHLAAVHDESTHVNPWLIPVLDGRIRLQKPPLPYWCDAVFFRLMGPSALSARLIPALLGLLATFLLYDLASMLMGRRVAWFTALLWLSSYFIPEEYRKTMADPYLAFFTLGCLWAWVKAAGRAGQSTARTKDDISALPGAASRLAASMPSCLVLFYLFLALGLLAKGPPLIAHLVIAIGAFHLCYRRRAPGRWWGHLCGVILVLLIGLPWAIYVYSHIPHVIEIWRFESIGELSDNTENARVWWFYFPQLFLLALPWVGLWILGIISPFLGSPAARRRRSLKPFFPLIWYAGTILFFSFVNLKKNAYLLPTMPAQALLMAQGAVLLALWLKRRPREPFPRIIIMAQAITGLGFALWLGWVLLRGSVRQPILIGIIFFLVALIAAAYPLWKAIVLDQRPTSTGKSQLLTRYAHWLAAQSVAYAILLSLFFNFYDAPKKNADSPRPFIEAIAPRLLRPGCTLARQRLDPAAAFYLPDGIEAFNPAASCIQIILERSPQAAAPRVADFDYLHLDNAIIDVETLQLPRLDRWRLISLKTRPQALNVQ